MTVLGWILMICSLTFVLGLNVFCFGRVLLRPARPAGLTKEP